MSALFVDPLMPTINQRRPLAALLHALHLPFKFSRAPNIVRIQRRDVCPARETDSRVASRADTSIGLPDQANSRITLGHARHYLRGVIGGTVIHYDDLNLTQGLALRRSNRKTDPSSRVERRDDHRDNGGADMNLAKNDSLVHLHRVEMANRKDSP